MSARSAIVAAMGMACACGGAAPPGEPTRPPAAAGAVASPAAPTPSPAARQNSAPTISGEDRCIGALGTDHVFHLVLDDPESDAVSWTAEKDDTQGLLHQTKGGPVPAGTTVTLVYSPPHGRADENWLTLTATDTRGASAPSASTSRPARLGAFRRRSARAVSRRARPRPHRNHGVPGSAHTPATSSR